MFLRLAGIAVAVAVVASLMWVFVLGGASTLGTSSPVPTPVPEIVVPVEVAGTPVFMPALTRDASELRRVAEEHARLLTSLPPTPEPTPTLTAEQLSGRAGVEVSSNPGGIVYPTPELTNWFDRSQGLEFYRPEGGDWTPDHVRENHPFRELFYYEHYPETVPNFDDDSMNLPIARRLLKGASDVLPILANADSSVSRVLARRVGWEVRGGALPMVNVWTTFEYSGGDALHVYAIGGVLQFEVRSYQGPVGPEDSPVDYLVPFDFVGPVVVQRLETRLP